MRPASLGAYILCKAIHEILVRFRHGIDVLGRDTKIGGQHEGGTAVDGDFQDLTLSMRAAAKLGQRVVDAFLGQHI